jgi:adenylate cyclase
MVFQSNQNALLKKLRSLLWQWRGVLIATPSVAAIVLGLRLTGLLQLWELAAFDQALRFRPPERVDSRIVIVDVTEADIQRVGKWPMSDAVLVKVLNTIKQQEPSAIGLDLFRDLPVEPGHQALVKIFRTTPNLIGVQKIVGDANSAAVAPPSELKQLGQIAANDFVIDPDGKIRRSLMYLTPANSEPILSLGLRLALIYLKQEKIELSLNNDQLQLGQVIFPPLNSSDGGYVQVEDKGYQMLLNYRGAARQFPRVTLTEVLEEQVDSNFFRGRIVLIGASAESLKDIFYTPYSSTLIGIPERMSGVEIHANLVSQILSATLQQRPLLQTWTEWIEVMWILGWTAIGAIVSWQERRRMGQGGLPQALILLLLLSGCLIVGSYVALIAGWWIPLVPALLGMMGAAIGITRYTARSANKIRETLGRYVDDSLVTSLLETADGLKLGGEKRKVTILISDIRGFSALSEELSPEQLVTLLNLHLGSMTEIIRQHRGVIEAFVGDGIVVVFGLPTAQADDAERSIACAIAMQLAMETVNTRNQKQGLPTIEMGIGIHTGEAVVGNIGSDRRTKYGVIGRTVNLAARIESYTVGDQILISEATRAEVRALLHLNQQLQIEPKGFRGTIVLHDVAGITGRYNLLLPQVSDGLIPLSAAISIKITVLDGKHLGGTSCMGSLIKLSNRSAEIQSEQHIPPLSDIKINLNSCSLDRTNRFQADLSQNDLYAKVVRSSISAGELYIRFTAASPEMTAQIIQWLADG